MRSLLPLALVLALIGSACGDDPITPTPTPTPVSPVTETFASGLVPLGTSSRTFDAAKAGSVTITLTSSGPPTDVTLGLGVGIPTPGASAGCSLTTAVNMPPSTTPQITVQVDAGKFCVKVFDTGTLTAQTFFSVTIVRP
ncbi:MAG: hypothetical protein WBD07_12110 [Vicinamibacterales bacterium]